MTPALFCTILIAAVVSYQLGRTAQYSRLSGLEESLTWWVARYKAERERAECLALELNRIKIQGDFHEQSAQLPKKFKKRKKG